MTRTFRNKPSATVKQKDGFEKFLNSFKDQLTKFREYFELCETFMETEQQCNFPNKICGSFTIK